MSTDGTPSVGLDRSQRAALKKKHEEHEMSATDKPTPFEMVREFHAKFGVQDSAVPDISQHRELRLKLIDEELLELREALAANDVVGVADGLADLLYVTIGAGRQWGIPLEAVFSEVHRSNMTKEGGGKREDGKILKGPGYEPPDVAGVLNGVGQ